MKVILHVPVEQYGFVGVEIDPIAEDATWDAVADMYKQVAEAFKPKPVNELPTKEWNECLNKYLLGQGMSEECMQRLSPKQSWMIHELDKSFSRINNKEGLKRDRFNEK